MSSLLPRSRILRLPLNYAHRFGSTSPFLSHRSAPQEKGLDSAKETTFSANHWDLSVGVVLFRLPVVAPPMSETEKRLYEHFATLQHESSLKSDFELKQAKDIVLLQKRKELDAEGKDLTEVNEEIREPCHELIEQWEKRRMELTKKYKLDDVPSLEHNSDPCTLRRRFDRKLVLLVRQKYAACSFYNAVGVAEDAELTSPWIVPELKNDGEPLRQTVERCIDKIISKEVPVRILGNAPLAFVRRHYPKPQRESLNDKIGTVIFFFAVQLGPSFLGPVEFKRDEVVDHRWCAADELRDNVKEMAAYRNCLKTILVEH